jgi:peptidyl-prolyl cis-trans isomerase SurA
MTRIRLSTVALGCLCVAIFGTGSAHAQGRASAGQGAVVATVGDEPIHAGDAERMLRRVTQGKEVSAAVLPVLQAQALAEVVDRQLALAYARRTQSGPSQEEIDAALGAFVARVTSQGRSLDRFLEGQGISQAVLRRQIAWELTWRKYLEKYVTEDRLASFFEAHRREFDGTQVSVSHILLRPDAEAGPEGLDALVKQAEAIRREIISGKIAFADAARKHSAAPSAKEGGSLGFIRRRGAMVEAFSRAAFALEAGQVSEPVTTRFGVHLIRCDEVKPGNKKRADVGQELEEALARELLQKLAQYEREHAPVRFTGKWPYFKPGTQELVVP